MKSNYLIGLGGSGGKIIHHLYNRLRKERGPGFDNDVVCVAIDTDQKDLKELSALGVEDICLSGEGKVGDYFNTLGDDVAEWCPNAKDEVVFFASDLYNGASQCRLKSRLCLATFLKEEGNKLAEVLEESRYTGNCDGSAENPPHVLIASSIAGGTGSGIFIQVALYVKQFFRRFGVEAKVFGLFACPDIYRNTVPSKQVPAIFANAYAVVRELNAMNLITGAQTSTPYGGKYDINMEISTSCEGNLFEKNSEGRYNEKPYDVMYFIDKINYLKRVRGGIDNYYKAMAEIAYARLYTDIPGKELSSASNDMSSNIVAPTGIYASAGAAEIKYPYTDIVKYFASRTIKESFSSVWTRIDTEWKNKCEQKNAEAREKKMRRYIPAPGERADFYIEKFEEFTNGDSLEENEFTFLKYMVKRGVLADNATEQEQKDTVVENYLTLLESEVESRVKNSEKIKAAKNTYGIGNIDTSKQAVFTAIDESGIASEASGIFSTIQEIDGKIEGYCKKGIEFSVDCASDLANEIFSTSKELWQYNDSNDLGLIRNLLYDASAKEWVHPVAARYLLYKFSKELKNKMNELQEVKTPADDVEDFVNQINNNVSKLLRVKLDKSDSDVKKSNFEVLARANSEFWGRKKNAKKLVDEYFNFLKDRVKKADQIIADAMMFFAFKRVVNKVNALIDEYEMFFDNIDTFTNKVASSTASLETMHDGNKDAVYVCADSHTKKKLYDSIGGLIDTDTGKTASSIAMAFFNIMRENAASSVSASNNDSKLEKGIEAFFNNVLEVVTKEALSIREISGALDMNVFSAMLKEYALTYPENADDEKMYSNSDEAKNRIRTFIEAKLSILSNMAAPMLRYDAVDLYDGLENKDTDNERVESVKTTAAFRFLTQNSLVENSIQTLVGKNGSASDFYAGFENDLPGDADNQSVKLTYVASDKVDKYTILCYSTVNCLQPYQIHAFNENKNGEYFKYYSQRIAEMERYQKFSLTPHLDKRWHKRGVMPYINAEKEKQSRFVLAKALLFALSHEKIGYTTIGSKERFVFGDSKLNPERKDMVIYHNGDSIPLDKLNRLVDWFADQEGIVDLYAAQFDAEVEKEIKKMQENGVVPSTYKRTITDSAGILNRLKAKALKVKNITTDKNGNVLKGKQKPFTSVLDLAYKLHISEEQEIDKDYGELIIDMLCETIKKYAKAPYNSDDVNGKVKGSEGYLRYLEVCDHVAAQFLEEYSKFLADANYNPDAKKEGGKKTKGAAKKKVEKASDESGKGAFGRNLYGLGENDDFVEDSKLRAIYKNKAVGDDRRFIWVADQFEKFLVQEIK